MESCYTSTTLVGEFTGGVVFEDDLGFLDQGVAQGGVVVQPDGRWFCYLFQDRGAAGRMPVLIPMTWEDGMPVIGENGKVPAMVTNRCERPGWVCCTALRQRRFPRRNEAFLGVEPHPRPQPA